MDWQQEIQNESTADLAIHGYELPPVYERANRYRSKIAFVSPHNRRISFEAETACFLGISLENRSFEPARFRTLLKWVAHRFIKCTLLIGYDIYRIALETQAGASHEASWSETSSLGHEFIDEHRELVESFRGGATDFEFVTCQQVRKTSVYTQYLQKIRAYFDCTPEFKDSIESFCRYCHRSALKEIAPDRREYLIRKSCDYLLEEFAVFSSLVKDGISVMVYPGACSTLAEIADGLFPGILSELQALTVVSIQLKRR